jgi:hypothetical protein
MHQPCILFDRTTAQSWTCNYQSKCSQRATGKLESIRAWLEYAEEI